MSIIERTHLGVYAVITRKDEILLIDKARGPYEGKKDLPGGRMEHGEDVEAALRREIWEETGIEATEFEPFSNETVTVEFVDSKDGQISMHHVGMIYKANNLDTTDMNESVHFEDVRGVGWHSVEKLQENELSPFAWRVVSRLRGLES